MVHFQAFRDEADGQNGQIRRTAKWLHLAASTRLTGHKARSSHASLRDFAIYAAKSASFMSPYPKVRKSHHRTQFPLNRTAVGLTMASVPFVSNALGSNPLICQGMDCRIKSCNDLPCGDVSRRQTWGHSNQQKPAHDLAPRECCESRPGAVSATVSALPVPQLRLQNLLPSSLPSTLFASDPAGWAAPFRKAVNQCRDWPETGSPLPLQPRPCRWSGHQDVLRPAFQREPDRRQVTSANDPRSRSTARRRTQSGEGWQSAPRHAYCCLQRHGTWLD